jgi:tetratricopeptide (TPR) repeat protein
MGDLARSLLSEEIRALNRARRSGILVATAPGVTKGVFLRGGRLVFASSSLDKDKLGENLIRLGRISRREFAVAYEATQLRKRRLGQTLLAAGVMNEEELGRIVAHQVQGIVLSLFTWTEGRTRFQEAQEPIPAELALDLSTHRLLFEGSRIYPDAGRLEAALGPGRERLRRAARPAFDVSRVTFSPAERAVLESASSGRTVGEVLADTRPSRSLLVRALYALLVGGLVETISQEESIAEADTGTFRLAVPVAPVPAAEGVRERVLRQYEALPRATHYEVLAVPPDANSAAIAAAYRALVDDQESQWPQLARDVQLGAVLGTLKLKRRDAHDVLSDPKRRAAYDRSLRALRPAPPAAPAAAAPRVTQRGSIADEARRLVEQGRPGQALPLLLEAVNRDPGDRASRRLLALCLAEHPTLFPKAERHFLAVLEADPSDSDLRYRFASYYKRCGLTGQAALQLQSVLAVDPGNEAAVRDLAILQSKRRGTRR